LLHRLGDSNATPYRKLNLHSGRQKLYRRRLDNRTVEASVEAERLSNTARSRAKSPQVSGSPSNLHRGHAIGRLERSHENRSPLSHGSAHKVEAPVKSVGQVHVGGTWWTEHSLVPRRDATKAMRGLIIEVVSLCLNNPSAHIVDEKSAANQRPGDLDRPQLEVGERPTHRLNILHDVAPVATKPTRQLAGVCGPRARNHPEWARLRLAGRPSASHFSMAKVGDASGKAGALRRISEHVLPRAHMCEDTQIAPLGLNSVNKDFAVPTEHDTRFRSDIALQIVGVVQKLDHAVLALSAALGRSKLVTLKSGVKDLAALSESVKLTILMERSFEEMVAAVDDLSLAVRQVSTLALKSRLDHNSRLLVGLVVDSTSLLKRQFDSLANGTPD